MDGYINVDVERAKKLANDVLTGVKEKRERLYQEAIGKELNRRITYNASWVRFFYGKMLSLDTNNVVEHLERIEKNTNKDWVFNAPYYTYAYCSAASLAKDILKLCKFPPVDGILTLESEDALALISWERD